jgi:iron complex transport system ATP-binding protein
LLLADNVSFAYGAARVLDGVTLRADAGATIGILGPNGAGKTTLLRLLSGTLAPDAGTVTLDGHLLGRWPRRARARRVAVVPQETQPAFDYSVLEIALTGRYPHLGAFQLEGPDDVAAARAALDSTGTLPFASRSFATLSGGEKQRVVIASALSQLDEMEAHPVSRYLLLDEPTASLDLRYQLEIAALLRRLNRDRGLAILLSTHDLNLAASVCTGAVLLKDGRIAAAGRIDDVITPANVRAVYGVEADVWRHPVVQRVSVLPLGPSQ